MCVDEMPLQRKEIIIYEVKDTPTIIGELSSFSSEMTTPKSCHHVKTSTFFILLLIGAPGSCVGFKPILSLCYACVYPLSPVLSLSMISADKHRRNISSISA